jgi:hypothetical protein
MATSATLSISQPLVIAPDQIQRSGAAFFKLYGCARTDPVRSVEASRVDALAPRDFASDYWYILNGLLNQIKRIKYATEADLSEIQLNMYSMSRGVAGKLIPDIGL